MTLAQPVSISYPCQETQLKGREAGRGSPNHTKIKCDLISTSKQIDWLTLQSIGLLYLNRAMRIGVFARLNQRDRSTGNDQPRWKSHSHDIVIIDELTGATWAGKLSRSAWTRLLGGYGHKETHVLRVGNLPMPLWYHTRCQVAFAAALDCTILVDTRAESLPRRPCFGRIPAGRRWS